MFNMIAPTWALLATLIPGLLAQPATPGPDTSPIDLLIRVFDGAEEVTSQTHVTVYRAGSRNAPVTTGRPTSEAVVFTVPTGFYDAQAVQERDGRVVNLRWAERLTVQRYPGEGGRHLETINFVSSYGALQISRPDDAAVRPGTWEAFAFHPSDHAAVLGSASPGPPSLAPPGASPGHAYALIVLEAGTYDVAIREAGTLRWYPSVEIPRGRTGVLRID